MRNLKKVLALTLAIALVLSLSVTAGAANFSDKEDITAKYQDAVDLMSELSIMNGFPDGTYQPQGELTRAQYLKMLYVVMNRGVDDQAILYSDVQPFPFYDVRSYDWHNGYVKWGYGRQLIDGRGGGIFDPNGTVTGFEALKMSLTALGYSTEIEGYTGDAWRTQVLNDAQDAGLLTDLETANLSSVLPREQAAQMLRNTLFAQMVNYNTSFIPAKMEKGQTMAYNYYNLYILRGVVVSNQWASVVGGSNNLAGETTISVDASNVPRDTSGNAIGSSGAAGYSYTLPYQASVEMLGHEVIVYARYANNYTVRPFDKVYGEMSVTDRSTETPKYAREDVTGALTATAAATDLGYYVTNGDWGMDATYANAISSAVDGTRLVVDYSVRGHGAAVSIRRGSPIKFIDNNNDGVFDFIIASNMTYAKVTNVTDAGAVTAFSGVKADNDFTGTAILSGVAAANIYLGYNEAQTERSETLKVDDRVLVYTLGGKYGIVPVKAIAGTLTSTNGADDYSVRATINGTLWRNWRFNSAVSSFEDTAKGDNFNTEKDWRFFGPYLLEGPSLSSASKQWALVLDSYASGNSSFNSFVKQVQVLLADGTTGVYNLSAIYDTDGNNGRDFSMTGTPGKLVVYKTSASVNYTLDDILDATPALNSYNLFQAVVSDDGASITLYEPKTATGGAQGEQNLGTASANAYTNGKSTFTTSAGTKNVLNNTAFFVVNPNADKAGVYVGRNLPTFAANEVTASRVIYADITGGQNTTENYIRAAVLLSNNIDVVTHSGNYALVVATPRVILDSAAGKYYAEIQAYNGTETKTYTTVNDLRSNRAGFGSYRTTDISTVSTGLNTSNLGVASGDVIEFGVNAEGKINALVTVGASDTSASSNGNGVYKGYYVTGGTGWVTFYGDKVSSGLGTLTQDVDAEFYNMTGTVGVKASAWPNANSQSAKYARMLKVDGEVIRVWVDTTDGGWNAGTTTGTGTGTGPLAILSTGAWVRDTNGTLVMGEYSYNNQTGVLSTMNVFGTVDTTTLTGAWKTFIESTYTSGLTGFNTTSGLVSTVTSAGAITNVALHNSIVASSVNITAGAGNSVSLTGSAGEIVLTQTLSGAAGVNLSGLSATNVVLDGGAGTSNVNATGNDVTLKAATSLASLLAKNVTIESGAVTAALGAVTITGTLSTAASTGTTIASGTVGGAVTVSAGYFTAGTASYASTVTMNGTGVFTSNTAVFNGLVTMNSTGLPVVNTAAEYKAGVATGLAYAPTNALNLATAKGTTLTVAGTVNGLTLSNAGLATVYATGVNMTFTSLVLGQNTTLYSNGAGTMATGAVTGNMQLTVAGTNTAAVTTIAGVTGDLVITGARVTVSSAVAAGGLLDGDVIISGGTVIIGNTVAGVLEVSNGAVTLNSAAAVTGDFTQTGGTVLTGVAGSLLGAVAVNGGTFTVGTGGLTMGSNENLIIGTNGTVEVNTGVVFQTAGTGGTITINGNLNILGTGSFVTTTATTLGSASTITTSAGAWTLTFAAAQTLTANVGARIILDGTGTVTAPAARTFTDGTHGAVACNAGVVVASALDVGTYTSNGTIFSSL